MDFHDAYSRLNDEQKLAVDTIYGPVAVIAGPGSGKTQLLSLRIAKILQEADISPESILCLTFTHSACETMRQRLLQLVGPIAYRVEIHTFHSFGALLLSRVKGITPDPEELTDSESFVENQVASRVRVAELLDHLIESLPFDHVLFRTLGGKEDRRSLIQTLQALFADLKNEQITPQKLATIADILKGGAKDFDEFILIYARKFEMIGPLRSKAAKEGAQVVWEEMLSVLPVLLTRLDISTGSDCEISPSYVWKGIFQDMMGSVYQNVLDGHEVKISDIKKKISDFSPTSVHTKSPIELIVEKVGSISELFIRYANAMQESGYSDFQDLLSDAYAYISEHPSVQSELAERYQFILIDEFQDTNELQLQLATSFLVGVDEPNIMVVGDDDQAIYKFQGATIANFQNFLHKYPQTQTIILKKNYRSTSDIITFSRLIMQGARESVTNFLSLPQKEFVAGRIIESAIPVSLRAYAQSADEMIGVIEAIESHRRDGGSFKDIAILARSNTTIRRYALALSERNIPCVLSSDEYFENDEMITQFVALSVVVAYMSGQTTSLDPFEAFGRVITSGLYGAERSHVWMLYIGLRESGLAFREMIVQMSLAPDIGVYGELIRFVLDVSMLVESERVEYIIDLLTGERSLSEFLLMHTSEYDSGQLSFGVNSVERRSPFYDAAILQYQVSAPSLSNARLHSFEIFISEVRDFLKDAKDVKFATYMRYIELGYKYGFPTKLSSLFLSGQDSVTLSTIHKAKGAEYKKVFVVLTTKEEYTPKNRTSLLPKSILPSKDLQDIDDERRLIYTACTRAEDELIVTRPLSSLSGRPSHPPDSLSLCDWQEMPSADAQLRQAMIATLHLSSDRIFWIPSQDELAFLRSRASMLNMNATLLSSFFDIARDGAEVFIRRSLLRLPASSSILQIQGTAFHKGLEWWVDTHTRTGAYRDEVFFEGVDSELARSRIFDTEREQVRKKITELFPLIADTIRNTQRDETFVEYSFGLGPKQERVYLNDIPLSGKIDRIDTHRSGVLELYDYKTSRLQNAKLAYDLQLSFYSVLISLSRRFASFGSCSYHLQALEPMKDGSLTLRSYYPSHTEIERDKKLIAYVYEKILACDFSIPVGVNTPEEWYVYILTELGYGRE